MKKLKKQKKEEVTEKSDVEKEIENAMKSVFSDEKSGLTKSIKDEVISEVQKLLDKHKEKKNRGVGVYSEEAQKDAHRKAVNGFLKEGVLSIVNGSESEGLSEARAKLNENTTDSDATPYNGYITDEFLSAEIRHLTTEYGVAAREMNNVTFMQSSYKANNLATDVTTYWVDEAGSIKSTQVVLGQETLELKKLAAIIAVTRELMQEQEIDFISFLGGRVAEGFAQAEDEAFFIGDGSSDYGSFTGLLENTSINEVTLDSGDGAFTDLTIAKLRAMQDETPQGALANAKYYMHRSILSILRDIRSSAVTAGDKEGVFLFKEPGGSDIGNIDGYPIVLVEAMPARGDSAVDTSFVLFGDLRKGCIRGTRGGIIADRFNAGSVRNIGDSDDLNLITTDREAVRWITQVGFVVIIAEAITKLTTNAASS